jgi:hypothetical protein
MGVCKLWASPPFLHPSFGWLRPIIFSDVRVGEGSCDITLHITSSIAQCINYLPISTDMAVLVSRSSATTVTDGGCVTILGRCSRVLRLPHFFTFFLLPAATHVFFCAYSDFMVSCRCVILVCLCVLSFLVGKNSMLTPFHAD